MATIQKNNIRNVSKYGGVPYGNLTHFTFPVVCNSSGVWADSNDATAVAIGDVLQIGILPAGFKPLHAIAVISDVAQAAATCKIGFAYVDGTDPGGTEAEDDDYWFSAGLDLATQSRTVQSNATVRPITLPKEAYVEVVWAGAENDEASRMDIIIIGEMTGP